MILVLDNGDVYSSHKLVFFEDTRENCAHVMKLMEEINAATTGPYAKRWFVALAVDDGQAVFPTAEFQPAKCKDAYQLVGWVCPKCRTVLDNDGDVDCWECATLTPGPAWDAG